MLEPLMWLVTIASVVGTVANAQQRIWCFPVWLVANVMWAAYNVHHGAYAQAALWVVYSVLAVYGWWSWARARRREDADGTHS